MTSLNLPEFNGPITAVGINEWLKKCEKKFQLWDENNQNNQSNQLKDQQKADSAGDKISSEGVTHDLADWWANTDDITTWAGFKEGIKVEALGPDWRARALEAFYSTKQDGRSADSYFRSLDENSSVIANGVSGSSQLKAIDPFTFKCYMLFSSTPAVTAQIMDDSFDIVSATIDQVKQKIKKTTPWVVPVINLFWIKAMLIIFWNSTSAGSPVLPLTGASGYLLLDQWGVAGTVFTDLGNLPLLAKDLGSTTRVTIWSNGNDGHYMIQQYQFEFSGSTTIKNGTNQLLTTNTSIGLSDGENIVSVTITGTRYTKYYSTQGEDSGYRSVSSMTMTTSANRTVSLSGVAANAQKISSSTVDTTTFTAPSGWRIVGFRGSTTNYVDYNISGSYAYPIVGLGAILAPVST